MFELVIGVKRKGRVALLMFDDGRIVRGDALDRAFLPPALVAALGGERFMRYEAPCNRFTEEELDRAYVAVAQKMNSAAPEDAPLWERLLEVVCDRISDLPVGAQ